MPCISEWIILYNRWLAKVYQYLLPAGWFGYFSYFHKYVSSKMYVPWFANSIKIIKTFQLNKLVFYDLRI